MRLRGFPRFDALHRQPMSTTARSTLTAMFCAAAVTAQFVGGKATRDALFLTSLDFTALPTMLIATSACSILLVAAHARLGVQNSPATVVPAAFAASGVLFVCEWLIRASAPSSTAVFVYLHVSGAGPLLASGFWLIATEHLDPRTAKRRFGRISGAGTLGGLLGALLAARVAAWGVPSMLLVLAALQFLSAGLVRRLAVQLTPVAAAGATTCLALQPLDPDCACRRITAPASPRRARPARHDERSAGRISIQGQGVRNTGPRRSSPALFLALLCRNQFRHAAPADCC